MTSWPLADVAQFVLDEAERAGATAADVVAAAGASLGVGVRLGETEKLKRAQAKHLGLRVFIDHRSAITSSADCSRDALAQLARDSCALARLMPGDATAGLPEPDELARNVPDLDLFDGTQIGTERALELARQGEAAALESDGRITNSEGAELDTGSHQVVYASSAGFAGAYHASSFSLWVTPIAAENGRMQRDYWYSSGRKISALDDPASIGRVAAQRALRRLGARQVATQEVPVVFESQVAASLLRHLAAAVSGYSLYKQMSFLVDKLGEQIAPEFVTVVDDGTLPGALGSRPFDGEGLATRRTVVVERGRLASYLFDTYSARKMGARSTGNAARSVGGSPGVGTHNFYVEPGATPTLEILRSTKQGLFVTELIGQGINPVTGDYSRGAVGLWIENGELAFPVEGITIAGNLLEMFRDIEAVGSELDLRSATAAPTIKIARMTVAGT